MLYFRNWFWEFWLLIRSAIAPKMMQEVLQKHLTFPRDPLKSFTDPIRNLFGNLFIPRTHPLPLSVISTGIHVACFLRILQNFLKSVFEKSLLDLFSPKTSRETYRQKINNDKFGNIFENSFSNICTISIRVSEKKTLEKIKTEPRKYLWRNHRCNLKIKVSEIPEEFWKEIIDEFLKQIHGRTIEGIPCWNPRIPKSLKEFKEFVLILLLGKLSHCV